MLLFYQLFIWYHDFHKKIGTKHRGLSALASTAPHKLTPILGVHACELRITRFLTVKSVSRNRMISVVRRRSNVGPCSTWEINMITLKPGDVGPSVKVLQTWLNALNPNPAPYSSVQPAFTVPKTTMSLLRPPTGAPAMAVTGVFDGDTEAAVRRIQCDRGLPLVALGTVDYATWRELAQMVRNSFVLNPPGTPLWLVRLSGPVVPPPRSMDAGRFVQGYTELFWASGGGAIGLSKLLSFINGDAALTDLRWAAYMFATVHCECGPTHNFLPIPEDGCNDNNRPVCSPLKNGNQRSYAEPVACGPDSPLLTRLKSEASISGLAPGISPKLARLQSAIPPQPPYIKAQPARCPAGKTFHSYYGRGYVQLTHLDNYQKMSQVTGQDLVHFPEKALDPETAYKIMSHGMRNGTFTGARLSHYIAGLTCNYYDARIIINGHDRAPQVEDWAKRYEIILYYSLCT